MALQTKSQYPRFAFGLALLLTGLIQLTHPARAQWTDTPQQVSEILDLRSQLNQPLPIRGPVSGDDGASMFLDALTAAFETVPPSAAPSFPDQPIATAPPTADMLWQALFGPATIGTATFGPATFGPATLGPATLAERWQGESPAENIGLHFDATSTAQHARDSADHHAPSGDDPTLSDPWLSAPPATLGPHSAKALYQYRAPADAEFEPSLGGLPGNPSAPPHALVAPPAHRPDHSVGPQAISHGGPTILDQLRHTSSQLDQLANHLETERRYDDADQLRQLAQRLRTEARQRDHHPAQEGDPAMPVSFGVPALRQPTPPPDGLLPSEFTW